MHRRLTRIFGEGIAGTSSGKGVAFPGGKLHGCSEIPLCRLLSGRGRSTGFGNEYCHADNADSGIFRLVPGDPGINRIQCQVGSEDLSGAFIHDGIHSSILSSELASCSFVTATRPADQPYCLRTPETSFTISGAGHPKKKSHTGSAWDSKSHLCDGSGRVKHCQRGTLKQRR